MCYFARETPVVQQICVDFYINDSVVDLVASVDVASACVARKEPLRWVGCVLGDLQQQYLCKTLDDDMLMECCGSDAMTQLWLGNETRVSELDSLFPHIQ